VFVWETRPGVVMSATAPDWMDWRVQATSFEELGTKPSRRFTLTGGGEPEQIVAGRASANYARVLGMGIALGRPFTDDDDRWSASPVVLLSHGLFQRRFGGDPSVFGRGLVLDGVSHEIIGVLAPHVRLTDDVWVPLSLSPQEQASTGARAYTVVGRLRAGVTIEQARDEMRAIAARIAEVRPGSNKEVGVELVTLRDQIVGDSASRLLVLLGAVAFLLLIASVNVANLMLARATTRSREMAVRQALGAGRHRLVRQLLTESVLLSLAGGVAGLLLARSSLGVMRLVLTGVPRLTELHIDGRVLAFTALLAIVTGLVFGVVPALRASSGTGDALREEGRGSAGRSRNRLRSGLVVAEIALSVVLLAGAGLPVRSFMRLTVVDPGFDPDHALAFAVSLPATRYADPPSLVRFFKFAEERLVALPTTLGRCRSRPPGQRLGLHDPGGRGGPSPGRSDEEAQRAVPVGESGLLRRARHRCRARPCTVARRPGGRAARCRDQRDDGQAVVAGRGRPGPSFPAR
jgi:putative ABC transport system permease protein